VVVGAAEGAGEDREGKLTVRLLVTGAGGQLGQDVAAAFAGHEVAAPAHAQLDVTDRDQVLGVITSFRPQAIVHCAAWTAVDACEADPDRAYAANALAVRHVAEGARRTGAHVCHISTDYVFDGTKASPYHEWDTPRPQSVYGASKLAGERELDADATIVRTSWVCGFGGANMVKTILRIAAQQPNLAFVDDQRGHPTFTADLALAVRRLVVDRRPGVFHVTNQGAVSWYEFAREVLSAAGLDPARVAPIATHELDPPRPAPRPANSVLDNAAWRLSGLPALRDFREPLAELVARLTA
jgi:dTDP-4-dehydrorhamnose reductase